MKLFYQSPQGEQMWFVAEVVADRSYRIVDASGNPNPKSVQHTENSAIPVGPASTKVHMSE